MDKLVLEGITHKGKNRIRENGPLWEVHTKADKVLFNPEPGPWLYISPVGSGPLAKQARWIKESNDSDFKVVNRLSPG